ncbi:hypothetical protein [Streptomyces griseocarneus]|uniref:hypothetical protein n=1 Tax=Streptomyces griseocarneus TaxID=51201 RepID=UPI00167E323F|nr:hypothetical protein [Streptomyces griseocarneus]MBZ6472344.1 hypothetical protein [Streptomyces griseocarneus]GHG72502.1 hypothetical protein GCM10018779_47910 [Streptomyces griseocarneus]
MPDLQSGSKKQDMLILAFTVLPPGAILIIGWIAKGTHGTVTVALIVLMALLATAPPLWGFWLHKKSRIQERARREALLAPIIDYIGESITKPGDAQAKVGQIHERLAPLLAESLGDGARCSFYSYDQENERLKREVVSGGPNGTPVEFANGSDEFRNLRHAMGQKVPVYTKDIQDPDANLNFTLGSGYKSIIAHGAWAGDELQGVLIIDAPNPGDLSRAKVPETYVWVFASLFGVSNALRN